MPERTCPRCDGENNAESRFCTKCGSNMDLPFKKERGTIVNLMIVITIFCAFVLTIEVCCLLVKAYDVMGILDTIAYRVMIFIPFSVTLFSITGTALKIYWILIVITITICASYALYKFAGSFFKKGDATTEETGFFWTSNLFALDMLISMFIIMAVMMAGGDVSSPLPDNPLRLMFSAANASVWEELVDRALFIGVPMAIASLIITKNRSSIKCILGGFGISKFSIVLITISAILFGASHFELWDQYWKILQTGVGGFFLSYVFVKYGLYASILMHFLTNFLSSFDWLLGADMLVGLIGLVLILAGLVVLIHILTKAGGSVKRIRELPVFLNTHLKSE